MGEISARHLRGDSMADVIFNGSASRMPVGQASVELVFDNSQSRLGGPWAAVQRNRRPAAGGPGRRVQLFSQRRPSMSATPPTLS